MLPHGKLSQELWHVTQLGRGQPAENSPKIPLLCDRPDHSISRKSPMATRSMALQMPAIVIGDISTGPRTLPCSGPKPDMTEILFSQLGHQAQLEVILIIWFLFVLLAIGWMRPLCCFVCLRYHRLSAERYTIHKDTSPTWTTVWVEWLSPLTLHCRVAEWKSYSFDHTFFPHVFTNAWIHILKSTL